MAELMAVMVASNTAYGAVTVYAEPYIGERLFCSTPQNPLTYDQATQPWVALPFDKYGIDWLCGDLILLRTPTGSIMARALDTGPFGGYCVAQGDGECLKIVADVPIYWATWPGLFSPGEVINLSAVARECKARGICD
ncbi:MAG: hypothetical protein KAJ19_19725 [Gammaproteobacteria bacterium]|nr:hypothetical protein [Gammaproteobacteria bacterium]